MIFEHFPYTNLHNLNEDWILNEVRKMSAELEAYVVNNQITFADPINWIITGSYAAHTITKDPATDTWYISRKPVPPGILITNGAYWEALGAFPQAEQSMICNVADYGVLGVEDADYTTELQEALDNTNYIAYYFPAGTYSFGTVYTSRPVLLFGAGETTIWKPLHRIATSNQYKTMLESTGDLEIRDIKIVGNNSVETQSGEKFLQTAIIRQYGHQFRMTGCIIDQIYDTWHQSQGSVAMPSREGLLLFVHNTEYAEINTCTFIDYGGEELIWISRDAGKFGDAAPVRIIGCIYRDKSYTGFGSAINTLGGMVEFKNCSGYNYYQPGSHANLLGRSIEVSGCVFEKCNMESWIDCCEGYYGKADDVMIHDNILTLVDGAGTYAVKAMARHINISNNHLEGKCPIKTYALLDSSHFQYPTYIPADVSWPDYDRLIIVNNTLRINGQPVSYLNAGININQSNQPTGSRSTIKEAVIENNVIMLGVPLTTYYPMIVCHANLLDGIIRGNKIPCMGPGAPSGSRIYAINLTEPQTATCKCLIANNSIESPNADAVLQMLGDLSTDQCKYQMIGNSIRANNTYRLLANLAIESNIKADYNLNFTANAG